MSTNGESGQGQRPRRKRGVRTAAGAALLTATVAAVTGFAPAPASTTARVDGVHQDLKRAVQYGDVSAEQAKRFAARVARQIENNDASA